jgi:hypothetical protein
MHIFAFSYKHRYSIRKKNMPAWVLAQAVELVLAMNLMREGLIFAFL